jgi:hypothetical protein
LAIHCSAPFHDAHTFRYANDGIYGTREACAYSGLMFAARITLAHFSVSWAINLPKPVRERRRIVTPASVSRATIFGSARAALISPWSFSTISSGVFLGATMPHHPLASKPVRVPDTKVAFQTSLALPTLGIPSVKLWPVWRGRMVWMRSTHNRPGREMILLELVSRCSRAAASASQLPFRDTDFSCWTDCYNAKNSPSRPLAQMGLGSVTGRGQRR